MLDDVFHVELCECDLMVWMIFFPQMGRSSGFNFGGSYSSHHPQQHRASSLNGSGVSYMTSGNSDLHFHGPEV